MSEQRVRVGVVAANPLAAWGLVGILEQVLPVEAVALSTDALLAADETKDGLTVVVLALDAFAQGDWKDPVEGVEAICATVVRLRRRRPALKVVVVGAPLTVDEVQRLIGAGAKGYLLESANEAEIKMAVEVVLDGSIWAPRKVLARLIDEGAAQAAGETAGEELSAREQQVMRLLMNGRSNPEIAAALGIEPATVKAHVGRMLRKTKSRNRLEMTLRVLEQQGEPMSEPMDIRAVRQAGPRRAAR